MRINQSFSNRIFLANLDSLNERLETASQQVSTGKKLLRLKDSPAGSTELLQLRSRLARLDQYRENIQSSQYYLNVADSALNATHNIVTTIFTRGSAAAGSNVDPAVRATLAAEVRSLRDQLLSIANSEAQGRYLFAGSQVSSPAFTIMGDAVSYQGDLLVNFIDIADGLTVQQNIPGSTAFSSAFSRIESLLTAMDAGDLAGIQGALDQFATALRDISGARGRIGIGLGRLEGTIAELDAASLNTRARQSNLEDANLAEAITQLTRIQTGLNAALTARTVTQQRNLFDFLA